MKQTGQGNIPTFTILSAVHNEETYIGEMIKSVLDQDYPDFELVIVDDRSSDRTLEVVASWSARDSRVRVIAGAATSGKNSAWNAAYQHAKGSWIVFLGGDDIMPASGLSGRYRYLAQEDPSVPIIAYSKVLMFGENVRYDGLVVPRGRRGSRSGPTSTLSRGLAEITFPLAEALPNEDIWVTTVAWLRAAKTIEAPLVCFHHRSHANNSFSRGESFDKTSEAHAKRAMAYNELARESRFQWTAEEYTYLQQQIELESLRREGRTASILVSGGVPLIHRLRLASQSSATLHKIRQRFYSALSGW